MRNKFLVLLTDENGVTLKKEYKNLKCVARDYPQLEYHQVNQIYLQSVGKTTRKQQPNNDIAKIWASGLRIFDNNPFTMIQAEAVL